MFRSSDGQGSLEYVGLLALVMTLLVLGAAAAEGPAVARRVTRQFARALCVVRAGDCERDREPCVVVSHSDREATAVKLVVVRLARGHTALVERRSDGTVAVTWTREDATGLARELGVGATVRGAGIDLLVGGELRAGALSTGLGGRTWLLPSAAAAQALVARLDRGDDDLPEADLVYAQEERNDGYGAFATVRAGAGDVTVDAGRAGGELALLRSTGARLDRRTGHRILYARTSLSATLGAQLGGGVLGLSTGSSAGGELYALELDEHGEPLDLAVVAGGTYAGSADLPAVLSPVAGRLRGEARGSRVFEVTTHLDLTEPANLAAAAGLLTELRVGELRFGRLLAAQRALRDRLAAAGTVEARVLDASASSGGFAVEAAAGGRLGLDKAHDIRDVRLLAAVSRGLDGQWIARDDCVRPA